MRAWLHAILGLGLLAGCAQEAPSASAPPAGLVANPLTARGDARLSVAHSGTRRFAFPHATGLGGEYRERITTDGQGRFALEPLQAHWAAAAEWGEFELTQRARQGFLFRYRDFLVRDAALFERNWSTTDLQRTEDVAGRACQVLGIERRSGERRSFEVSIDPETGLILASRERDAQGDLLGEMVYETLRLDPDLASVVWHQPSNLEQALGGVEALEQELGVDVLRPRLLPDGYAPLEMATVADSRGTSWLKLTYSDGIEPLFFLQALSEPRVWSLGGGASGERPAAASSVMVFELGTATALQGTVEGFRLIAIGKVREAELLDLVESSLP